MRLIDADKIIEHLEKVKNESAGLVDIAHIIGFQSVIDAQPTAYEVDAVVKQLEELRHIDICDHVGCHLCPYTKSCSATSAQTVNLIFDKAVEIVKRWWYR